MVNYINGKVYAIRSYETDRYYIGATCSLLHKRFFQHKNAKNSDKANYCTSHEILKYDDCYIELIEDFPCENKNQLQKREGELIRENKENCVNCVIPKRTHEEYKIDNKEKVREWKKMSYERNKEKVLKSCKEYREANKDKIKITKQVYQEANKEQIKIKKQVYYEKNKDYIHDKLNKVIECDCGNTYTHGHKARHSRTKRHLDNI